MRALIIEDQFIVATMIEAQLRVLGYDAFEIVDSEDAAIAAAIKECPDLITADDRLERGSGIEAIRRICADRPIAVVFVVGSPLDVKAAIPDAVTVEKPFTTADFERAVETARRSLLVLPHIPSMN